MTKKDLDKIRDINQLIYLQTWRIYDLRARAAIGGRALDPIGGSHGSPANRLELIYEKIDKEQRKYDDLCKKRDAEVEKLKVASEILDDKQRSIIFLRYVETSYGHPLDWAQVIEIAEKRHKIQERRVYELHHIAVHKLESYNI